MVTVYSKESCPACRLTERYLSEHNIDYVGVILVAQDGTLLTPEAEGLIEGFRVQGYSQFPVIKTPTDEWCGFRPNKLEKLIKKP